MRTIWKYQLEDKGTQLFTMPMQSRFLSLQMQGTVATMWFEVNPNDTNAIDRRIEIYGTGHKMAEGEREYLGTFQKDGFVWHVFNRIG